MPEDKQGNTVPRSEFYRIVGLLLFFSVLLSIASLQAAGLPGVPGTGTVTALVEFALVVFLVAAFSIYYSVRSIRQRKREAKDDKRAEGT